MRKGWEIKKLGEILQKTETVDPTRNPDDEFTYIDVSSVNNRNFTIENTTLIKGKDAPSRARKLVQTDDVIFATVRPTLKRIAIIPEEFNNQICSTGYFILRGKDFIENKYLFYFLLTEGFMKNMEKLQKGASYPAVTDGEVRMQNISYPKYLPEQQRIVAVLDEAFEAIDQAKANTERNLQNARELFQSELNRIFTNKGEGWEEKKLSEVAKVNGGYSFKSNVFKNEGKYQVLRMGNVRPGVIRPNESPVFVDDIDQKALEKSLLQINDVIITQTGTKNKRDYGFTALIDKDNYLLNQRIASIRFSINYLPRFFLYFSWTNIFKDQYFKNETGTVGQGNVGIGAITEALIPFIPVSEQQQIVNQLDFLSVETKQLEANYQKKLEGLEELKKSILQKAFSGELTRETTEIQMEQLDMVAEEQAMYNPNQ